MSNFLSHLSASGGARKSRKRVGRGDASGHGGTSTRGHKGQNARSGSGRRSAFEGGQISLVRRLPKRGFFNFSFRRFYSVNLSIFNALFVPGSVVTPELLKKAGFLKSLALPVKILKGGVPLSVRLVVYAHSFSVSAKTQIEALGGEARLIS